MTLTRRKSSVVSRANASWDDCSSAPMVLESSTSCQLGRSQIGADARRVSLDGGGRILIDEERMNALLRLLRTDRFAGVVDPEYHAKYFEQPLPEIREHLTEKSGIPARLRRVRPFASYNKPDVKGRGKTALKTKIPHHSKALSAPTMIVKCCGDLRTTRRSHDLLHIGNNS